MKCPNLFPTGRDISIIVAICLLVGCLIAPAAWSQKASPKALSGFGGLEWGDSTAKFKQMDPSAKLSEPKKEFQYGVASPKSAKIGIESMSPPKYRFYKDRYYLFSASFADERDFTLIEEALISKYGPGKETSLKLKTEKTGVRIDWEIENKLSITLRWSQLSGGELVYGYLPILREISSEQRETIKENL